ncbi:SDR family NAD(P)-dependent oxidoreductase [Rhizorhapis sp. SPR117]|uniref:SDR family NAD(P)-dependent oxidoreductase n=1 Tax=Rhizorhapis sp. SPR117 TaxID=2912611 RepID=UPI001F21B928|nr:SDR family NAD(P)-dependent oxidoreductase [Rhizorhapis sp. SPR117]
MSHMMIFGLGYTSGRLAERLRSMGWKVTGTRRCADGSAIASDDEPTVAAALYRATHILSSVPPVGSEDPVLSHYGAAIAAAPAIWTGYLSSTGVYGDTGGAWVDETAPIGSGRRSARSDADLAWQALRDDVHVFRLPGIYGPGRSVLDRIQQGKAHRIDLPGQVFSRVHVEDIVSGVIAGLKGPAGVYNLADDLPASQNAVIAHGCDLLGQPLPPLLSLQEAGLSTAALGFYAENRRIANGKAKRVLGWRPRFSTYKSGLANLARSATTKPTIDNPTDRG